ncbi:MAG: hypothetical protein PHW52_04460, partial [Candidatus Pacebacteria bacterium]|nr:hypothetical protein [Candidatus Paceibacterota bacterium]
MNLLRRVYILIITLIVVVFPGKIMAAPPTAVITSCAPTGGGQINCYANVPGAVYAEWYIENQNNYSGGGTGFWNPGNPTSFGYSASCSVPFSFRVRSCAGGYNNDCSGWSNTVIARETYCPPPACNYSCGGWSGCSGSSHSQTRTCTATNWYCSGSYSYTDSTGCTPACTYSCSWTGCSGSSHTESNVCNATNTPCSGSTSYTASTRACTPACEWSCSAYGSCYQSGSQWIRTRTCSQTNAPCSGSSPATTEVCAASNGACGSSGGSSATSAPTANLCAPGTASSVSGTGPWTWTCSGQYGGTTASCTVNFKGTCGTSNGGTFTSAPTTGLCTTGTPSLANISGTNILWTCSGSNPSVFTDDSSCSALFKSDGICGSANGGSSVDAPTTGLCNIGTASTVSVSGNAFNWTCSGVNGGVAKACSSVKVLPSCGSASGSTSLSAPTTNLCEAGIASPSYGTGSDGSMNLSPASSTTYNLNTVTNWPGSPATAPGVNFSVTENRTAGGSQVVIDSSNAAGLSVGDEILIINLQGTSSDYANVGKYETVRIKSITVNTPAGKSTLTLDSALVNTYNGTTQKIMVQRIPNWNNVTIGVNAIVTANAWDGAKGGVVIFRSNGVLTESGIIDVNGKGFRGDAVNGRAACGYPWPTVAGGRGESYTGTNYVAPTSRCASALGNHVALPAVAGGGGGGAGSTSSGRGGGGGGGGGHAVSGNAGAGTSYGEAGGPAGGSYGAADLSNVFLGSGGGASGTSVNGGNIPGGNGGGIIMIYGNNIYNTGTIRANGTSGANGNSSSADDCAAGGGGGAGGSVLITGNVLALNTTTASVGGAGGNGGTNAWGGSCGAGGAGSSGRVAFNYYGLTSGSSTPAATVSLKTLSFPVVGPWDWYCASMSGSMSLKCSASQTPPSCGSASGSTSLSAPTTNLCEAGIASPSYGTGSDGSMNLSPASSTTYNLNTVTNWPGSPATAPGVNFSVTENRTAGGSQVVIDSSNAAGLSVGDEILIINLQGTSSDYANVGKYETVRIKSITVNTPAGKSTLTLDSALVNTYNGTTQKIMVQRIPNWNNVTIGVNAIVTANAWDGAKGGVVIFRSNGVLTESGIIDVNGKGFRGDAVNGRAACGYPWPTVAGGRGESYTGTNYVAPTSRCASALGNHVALPAVAGGGGGGAGSTSSGRGGGGGGGGGHAVSGNAGAGTSYGEAGGPAGGSYGAADLSNVFLGSGGGASGTSVNGGNIPGGNGGGIIMIYGNNIYNTGTIRANGTSGANGNSSSADDCAAGGGGGAGGSVLITGNVLALNTTTASVGGAGGNGGTNAWGGSCGAGGAGSSGRVAFNYYGLTSGSSTPAATVSLKTLSFPANDPWKWYCISSMSKLISSECSATKPISLDAAIVLSTIPVSMEAGKSYSVSVTMKNTGVTPWVGGNEGMSNSFALGGVGDGALDSGKFGLSRFYIPAGTTVSTGGQFTFNFTMTAPVTSGSYNPQYRMIQKDVSWFGQTSSPTINVLINGVCGTNNTTYTELQNAYTGTFCNSGTTIPASPAFPSLGGTIYWACQGANGGTTTNLCNAKRAQNAICPAVGNYDTAPTPTCTIGTPGIISGTGPWTWTCTGINGGTNASCSANKKVNGACGTSATNYAYSATAFTGVLCTSGTAVPATPTFPALGSTVTWACNGINGGTSVTNCSATRASNPLNANN